MQDPATDTNSLRELFATVRVMAERHPQAVGALHGPREKGSDPIALQRQRDLDVEGFVAQ
ncbi:hypothetical protein GV67_08240 [Pseudorhizobium pelagicum]|uniref:Uncharacterized protein n=1 Tax=Pseudorhizobium pelagicum TaxID=1509405 RepID=A0A922T7G5_9HYPH|nr:hypothetical protein GV67_08240 [Pseudorhizobium pelagicum]KEQ06649.1 hypothetical protein GV68_06215 [Pseudorhizobium pelagicum]